MAGGILGESAPESSSRKESHRESPNVRIPVMDSSPRRTRRDPIYLGVLQSVQRQWMVLILENIGCTSSPRLAQSRLLTYRLRPSSMTSLPNSFSNLPGLSFVGSPFSNGQPPFGSFGLAGAGAVAGAAAVLGTADSKVGGAG